MSNLIDRIKAGSSHKKTIDWPGAETETKVDLRICSESDNLESQLAADRLFKDSKVGLENIDMYNAEVETQLLFRAVMDPETGKQLFNNITVFRSVLTPEIKNVLADELDALHTEYNPDPAEISDEDFDALVNDVKKKPEEVISKLSDIYMLRKLALFLASQP